MWLGFGLRSGLRFRLGLELLTRSARARLCKVVPVARLELG